MIDLPCLNKNKVQVQVQSLTFGNKQNRLDLDQYSIIAKVNIHQEQ